MLLNMQSVFKYFLLFAKLCVCAVVWNSLYCMCFLASDLGKKKKSELIFKCVLSDCRT